VKDKTFEAVALDDAGAVRLVEAMFQNGRARAMKLFEKYFRTGSIDMLDKYELSEIADMFDHYLPFFDLGIDGDEIMKNIKEEARVRVLLGKRGSRRCNQKLCEKEHYANRGRKKKNAVQ